MGFRGRAEDTYTIARYLVCTRPADLDLDLRQQGAIEELLSGETIPGSISKVTRQEICSDLVWDVRTGRLAGNGRSRIALHLITSAESRTSTN